LISPARQRSGWRPFMAHRRLVVTFPAPCATLRPGNNPSQQMPCGRRTPPG
jgi:hypothetical protein